MRTQLAIAGAVVAVAALGATAPSAVQAAGQITGHDIKNDSVTGKDVKEASLGQVPRAKTAETATTATTAGSATTATTATTAGSATTAKTADSATTANGLSTAASGKSMSGVFSVAGDAPAGGFLGVGITYPQALAAPIANNHVIDTAATPNPALCPGAGQAAPGYLCLYLHQRNAITSLSTFVYSTATAPYNAPTLGGKSLGMALYASVTGGSPYADGVWTVTAP